MKVAIVGHGPSLLKVQRGREIDSHDAVVRIKRCWNLTENYPQIYGSKTTHVIGSLKIADEFCREWGKRGVKNIWLFEDSRTEGKGFPIPEGAYCNAELCKKWRDIYLTLRKPVTLDPHQKHYVFDTEIDHKGHPHQSAGSHAILYALELLKPETLTLYGFDSLSTGTFTWSVTRGTEWTQYPDHNWPAERLLLNEMAKHYGCQIKVDNGESIKLYAA